MLTKNVWRENANTVNKLRSKPEWVLKTTSTRAIISALGVTLSLSAGAVHAASLNKCLDVYGKVTYSNIPCKDANQVRKVEIDPAPPVPRVAPITAPPKVEVPVYVMPEKSPELGPADGIKSTSGFTTISPRTAKPVSLPPDKKAVVKLETFGAPKKHSQNTCDTLTDKLGLVLDKMDAARRKGYTQKQMDEWNLEIKSLEHKKQQTGCF